jgi:hypothetical protein
MGAALEFSSNDPASRGGRLSFMLKAVSVLASLGLKIRKLPSRPPPGFIQVKRKVPG